MICIFFFFFTIVLNKFEHRGKPSNSLSFCTKLELEEKRKGIVKPRFNTFFELHFVKEARKERFQRPRTFELRKSRILKQNLARRDKPSCFLSYKTTF